MSRYDYDGGWAPYIPVAERRRRAAREVGTLRRKGHPVAPVTIEGRQIATTFWGKAWCDNLESYHHFENRLPRGRTYVRNGSVLDLQIARGKVTALVSGSELYRVTIGITEIPKARWEAIRADCSTGIDSLVELLRGRFSKGIMERLCRQDTGLFPKPAEIRLSCTCRDYASMCKHVAAALYGIGARLDHAPELLFQLRGVDAGDLVAQVDASLPILATDVAADKMLAGDDLSALFGLDMAEQPAAPPEPPRRRQEPKSSAPEDPEPAAKVSRAKTPGIPDTPSVTLTVAVFIPPHSPNQLGVAVTDGGRPMRSATSVLVLDSQTLGEALAQAREFVERAIDDLFGPQWTRWFQASYGWQLTEIGFDPETGLHLHEPIPPGPPAQQTEAVTRPARKPPRGVRANGRLSDRKPTSAKTRT
jgi:uncharacterized Zn finger protein